MITQEPVALDVLVPPGFSADSQLHPGERNDLAVLLV
jgi:hypothetical protein